MAFRKCNRNVVVVTGANRGIGFEFVTQFCSKEPHPAVSVIPLDSLVIATYRTTNADLLELQRKVGKKRLILYQLDITDEEGIRKFVTFMEEEIGRLDFLLNNAGITEPNFNAIVENMTPLVAAQVIMTNAIAPVYLTKELMPLLTLTSTSKRELAPAKPIYPSQLDVINAVNNIPDYPGDAGVPPAVIERRLFITKGGKRPSQNDVFNQIDMVQRSIDNTYARVAFISSSLGSISVVANSFSPSYRASKAALNMYIRCLSKEYPEIAFVALHPGWVQTDMGKRGDRNPNTPVDVSVRGLLEMIKIMNIQDSGKYLESYDGSIWPF